jgi:hypothetical protein
VSMSGSLAVLGRVMSGAQPPDIQGPVVIDVMGLGLIDAADLAGLLRQPAHVHRVANRAAGLRLLLGVC